MKSKIFDSEVKVETTSEDEKYTISALTVNHILSITCTNSTGSVWAGKFNKDTFIAPQPQLVGKLTTNDQFFTIFNESLINDKFVVSIVEENLTMTGILEGTEFNMLLEPLVYNSENMRKLELELASQFTLLETELDSCKVTNANLLKKITVMEANLKKNNGISIKTSFLEKFTGFNLAPKTVERTAENAWGMVRCTEVLKNTGKYNFSVRIDHACWFLIGFCTSTEKDHKLIAESKESSFFYPGCGNTYIRGVETKLFQPASTQAVNDVFTCVIDMDTNNMHLLKNGVSCGGLLHVNFSDKEKTMLHPCININTKGGKLSLVDGY